LIVGGSRISAVAVWISAIACDRATPGVRSNEIVTDGSWPRCVIASGPIVGLSEATELSGTSAPLSERT
jgi:hypothetical protein